MTDQERNALGRYVRFVADELGLRDWWLDLSKTYIDEDGELPNHYVTAEVTPTWGKRHAIIRVCEAFKDHGPEEIRRIVVHELLHLHTLPIRDAARLGLINTGRLSQSEVDIIKDFMRRDEEHAVDAIALAIAKHFPLIDWTNSGEQSAAEAAS